jgi:hypothetical protein
MVGHEEHIGARHICELTEPHRVGRLEIADHDRAEGRRLDVDHQA